MTAEEYILKRKEKSWNFSAIVDEDAFLHVNKIHPLKQQQVCDIVAAAKKDNAVNSVIIFGSATRYDCDIDSDLDICIDWKNGCYDDEGVLKPFTRNMYKTITEITKGNVDIINKEDLPDTYLTDAVKQGVVVYEQNV